MVYIKRPYVPRGMKGTVIMRYIYLDDNKHPREAVSFVFQRPSMF